MYESYFDLKEPPYSTSPDPRFIYLTAQHQEALAKCEYAISQRMGLSTIYGDIGTGKTSLARRLLQQFSDDPQFKLAFLVHPNYPSPFQFIKEIRREFGQTKPRRSLTDELNEFREFLIQQHEQDNVTVVVIDEAQSLTPPLFEVLRHLLNFETNTQKLLQIVLFWQNQLATKLDRMPALKDRVTIFGALSSRTKTDTDALIDFRWKVAGGTGDHPFSEDALKAILRYSGGRPRQLCKICDNALIQAFTSHRKHIDDDIIRAVIKDIRITESADEHSSNVPDTVRQAAPAAAAVLNG